MEKNEYIYVVFIKALTGLGSLSRLLTRYEYSHIAVCLEPTLEDFATFSRRKHYAPFESGFMHETRDCYAFGDHKSVKIMVSKVPVSSSNKSKIRAYIAKMEADPEYLFNIYSMVIMPIIHGFPICKTHNCMSFVSKILELSGTVVMEKPYYRYSIPDLDALLATYHCGEYQLSKKSVENEKYMDKVGMVQNLHSFWVLNVQLIYRIWKHRKDSWID